MPDNVIRKTHCNRCGYSTNHLVLHEQTRQYEDEEVSTVCCEDVHSILQCHGCDDIHFVHFITETRCWDPEEDEVGSVPHKDEAPFISRGRYPPAMPRRCPEWVGDSQVLPQDIRDFLTEIYVARQNENLRLCALGIRSLIEQIMISKISDTGNLGLNINAFFSAGYVASGDQDHFRDKVIGVGDPAMHRTCTPEPQEIDTLLDIIEGLIASLFVHSERVRTVGAKMPARASKVTRLKVIGSPALDADLPGLSRGST